MSIDVANTHSAIRNTLYEADLALKEFRLLSAEVRKYMEFINTPRLIVGKVAKKTTRYFDSAGKEIHHEEESYDASS